MKINLNLSQKNILLIWIGLFIISGLIVPMRYGYSGVKYFWIFSNLGRGIQFEQIFFTWVIITVPTLALLLIFKTNIRPPDGSRKRPEKSEQEEKE